MNYPVPILIIAFNRPEVSQKTFERVGHFQPSHLFVAIDGARENVDGEKELVEQVLSVYQKVDWNCDVHFKVNDSNQGAEITVSSAVSWALSFYDYCIVLEDDILVTESFLHFAEMMLRRYANDERVYMVSGAQFTPMNDMETDYVFSIYGHTGFGWATWRRAWKHFSFDLSDYDFTLADKQVAAQFCTKRAYSGFVKSVKRMRKIGSCNCSWDRCWSYVRLRDCALNIVPKYNLTQNIGVYGLHANGIQGYHKYVAKKDFQVTKHPLTIEVDSYYDNYHYNHYLYHSFLSKVKSKIRIWNRNFKARW